MSTSFRWMRRGRHPDLSNLTIHRLFAPLRPRLMLRILMQKPDQLLQHFPNYEFHLQRRYHTEFVYPLFHVELSGHPASPISALLRKTGSMTDIRPAALARVIERVRPDLVVSIGLDHAAAVTLRARARLGPGFPAWLLCTRRERTFEPGAKHPHEIVADFLVGRFLRLRKRGGAACGGQARAERAGPAVQLADQIRLRPARTQDAVATVEAAHDRDRLLPRSGRIGGRGH